VIPSPLPRIGVLTENRNGLMAEVEVLQANATAERDAATVMTVDERYRVS